MPATLLHLLRRPSTLLSAALVLQAAGCSEGAKNPVSITGTDPVVGETALTFKREAASNVAIATIPMNTKVTGSTMVACVGRGVIAAHAPPTDNKGNTYTQLGTTHAYTNWPFSGTACYAATNATGGSGHVVTAPVGASAPSDETTMSVLEIANAGRIQDVAWSEDLTSPNGPIAVTTTGPATLIAVWWGDAGVDVVHTASPGNGFTMTHTALFTGSLVQAAVATKTVSAAGTYDITWTSNQGAQLWLIAVQK